MVGAVRVFPHAMFGTGYYGSCARVLRGTIFLIVIHLTKHAIAVFKSIAVAARLKRSCEL
jgi:hypothetical protein